MTGCKNGEGTSSNHSQPAVKQNAESIKSSISKHLQNQDTKFTLELDSRYLTRLNHILESAVKMDDYIRYIIDYFGYTARQYRSHSIVIFEISYLESPKQTAFVDNQVRQILDQILKTGMNDYEIEKAVHDYIVTHVSYDTTYSRYTAYAALTKGKAVCQGYALLTQRMLKSAGIVNHIISGRVRGEPHLWNIVRIDGRWYQLDATWNNPRPDISGRVRYKYYNLTDDEMSMDHTWYDDRFEATSNFVKVLRNKIKSDSDKADFYYELLQYFGSL